MTAVAAAAAQAAATDRERAAENFQQADTNADGMLTLGEFTTLIDLNAAENVGRPRMIRRFGRYRTAFGRVNANADGLVTPGEMAAMAATTTAATSGPGYRAARRRTG